MVHVQQPVKALGINRTAAMLCIFIVSAALHEVVLSVPFKAFKLWAFWGMMGQVPIIIGTRAFRHHKFLGNIIFWSCFAIGQSVIVLMCHPYRPLPSLFCSQRPHPYPPACRYYVAYTERLLAGGGAGAGAGGGSMHTEL